MPGALDTERIREGMGTTSAPDSGGSDQRGGVGGRIARVLTATANAGVSRLVIDLLEVKDGERVLEIGFGSGHAIQLLAARVPRARIAGIDRSAVMLSDATQRNRDAILRGAVELKLGAVSTLPFADQSFDKVYAVNSFQFWPEPVDDLREVRRVLRVRGLLLLALPLRAGARRLLGGDGFTREEATRVEAVVRTAGFDEVSTSRHRLLRDTIVCIHARPGPARSGGA